MATRLYFHAAASSVGGTLPSGEQSSLTATVNGSGSGTVKSMNTTIGASQATITYTSSATTSRQFIYLGMWVSDTLNTNQTVGGGALALNGADMEANLNSNAWLNTAEVYVWRPSTGAKVGTVKGFFGSTWGGLEPTSAGVEQVSNISGLSSSAVSALAGDVIVCELWIDMTQAMGSAYANAFYYDGTTVNTTENATVSNHASFIEFAENLTFGAPGTDLGTATASCVCSVVKADLQPRFEAAAKVSVSAGYTVKPWALYQGPAWANNSGAGRGNLPDLFAYAQGSAGLTTTADGSVFSTVSQGGVNCNWGSLPNLLIGVEQNGNSATHAIRYSSDGSSFTQISKTFPSAINVSGVNAVAGNNLLFWFAGGVLIKTNDAVNWTLVSNANIGGAGAYSPTLGMWITYNASTNAYATSIDDGATWTARTFPAGFSPVSVNYAAVAAKGGTFIAALTNGTTIYNYTSTDGVNWTQRTAPVQALSSVAASDAKFYWSGAQLHLHGMYSSSDGITWTAETLPTMPSSFSSDYSVRDDNNIAVMAITGGYYRFLMKTVGPTRATLTSADGLSGSIACSASASLSGAIELEGIIAVTPQTAAVEDTTTGGSGGIPANTETLWKSVAFGAGIYVAVAEGTGGATATYWTSTDGISWTSRTLPSADIWASIAFGGGRFVLISKNTTQGYWSTDGLSWTSTTLPAASIRGKLLYGGTKFMYAGPSGATSTDGTSWSAFTVPDNTVAVPSPLAYNNGRWLTIYRDVFYTSANDGGTWTSRGTTPSGSTEIAGGNGYFVQASNLSNVMYASPNGVNWNAYTRPALTGTAFELTNLTFANGVFFAPAVQGTAAADSFQYLFSPDGRNWELGTASPTRWSTSLQFPIVGYGTPGFLVMGRISGSTVTVTWVVPTYTRQGGSKGTGTATSAINPIGSGTMAVVASATGALTTQIQLASNVAAVATGSGALTTQIRLAGSASALTTISGALTTQIRLASALAAQATGAGALTTAIQMAGTLTSVATATGALTTQIRLAGSTAVATSASGTLTTAIQLAGNAVAVATGSGALTTQIRLAGSAVGVAAATGTLTTQTSSDILGTGSVASTATGALTTAIRLVGSAATVATGSGALTTQVRLAGSIAAQAAAAGTLTTQVRLAGSIAAQVTCTAALTTQIRLAGSAAVAASGTGSLQGGVNFQATAAGVATAAGALTTGIRLEGSAASAANITAALLTQIRLQAALTCQASASASWAATVMTGLAACSTTLSGTLSRFIPPEVLYDPLTATEQAFPAIANFADTTVQSQAGSTLPAVVSPHVATSWATSSSTTLIGHPEEPDLVTAIQPP